jgi:hypothetical protein
MMETTVPMLLDFDIWSPKGQWHNLDFHLLSKDLRQTFWDSGDEIAVCDYFG